MRTCELRAVNNENEQPPGSFFYPKNYSFLRVGLNNHDILNFINIKNRELCD